MDVKRELASGALETQRAAEKVGQQLSQVESPVAESVLDALQHYQKVRLVYAEEIEDAVLPRLEALVEQMENDPTVIADPTGTDAPPNEDITKSTLKAAVWDPFLIHAKLIKNPEEEQEEHEQKDDDGEDSIFFFFVCFTTTALELHGPDRSAIRLFQNAIRAMATTATEADLWKSWITHTRKTGILTRRDDPLQPHNAPVQVVEAVVMDEQRARVAIAAASQQQAAVVPLLAPPIKEIDTQ